MNDALKFLLAAKRAEIQVLRQLALTCELVDATRLLVHMLQRERGASNMYLASGGIRFVEQLDQYRQDVERAGAGVRTRFDRLDLDAGENVSGVRLFSRVAHVLHGLDSLPALRERIQALALSPDEAASAFSHLVAGLLGVVFEAADAAADPEVSRALVALFNFIQGKEFAGQERAAGVAGFALGRFDPERQQRLSHLIDAQERCLDVFAEFATPVLLLRWHNAVSAEEIAEIERFRRMSASAPRGSGYSPDAGEQWFELTTRRIDAMKEVEDAITAALSGLCAQRIATAELDLRNHKAIMATLSDAAATASQSTTVFFTPPVESSPSDEAGGLAGSMGHSLGRSVLDLVQAQSQRIQRMADELNAARSALHERKLIERGKGLLMAQRGLSEDQAYRLMRQTAMDQGRRMVEVAESILSLGQLLGQDAGRPDEHG